MQVYAAVIANIHDFCDLLCKWNIITQISLYLKLMVFIKLSVFLETIFLVKDLRCLLWKCIY